MSDKHAMMFLKIWCFNTVIFSYLSTHQTETYDLVVDWNVHLLFQLIKIVVRKKWIFNVTFNCYLLLMHYYHVCLEDWEFILWYFADINGFVFLFDYVTVVYLMINNSCTLMHQLYIIVFICYNNSVEIGKYVEISDEFVCWKSPYSWRLTASIDRKSSDIFL